MERTTQKLRIYGKILKTEMLEDDVWEISYEGELENLSCLFAKGVDEFVLVDAESLSLDDEFLKYEPNAKGRIQFMKKVKKGIIKAIKSGTKNFYRPKNDPSFIEETEELSFLSGQLPAVREKYDWWEKAAKDYAPERGSRLGTINEYYAFLGVLIKKLMENGMSHEKAWRAVCVDSKDLGHYSNSKNAKHEFEYTGSREICGFCDLANTIKILAWDDKDEAFCLAGGSYKYDGFNFPLADLGYSHYRNYACGQSVGWLVLSK